MHPDIRIELARLKQADLIAEGAASKAAARAVEDDAHAAQRWLSRLIRRRINRPRSRRRALPA